MRQVERLQRRGVGGTRRRRAQAAMRRRAAVGIGGSDGCGWREHPPPKEQHATFLDSTHRTSVFTATAVLMRRWPITSAYSPKYPPLLTVRVTSSFQGLALAPGSGSGRGKTRSRLAKKPPLLRRLLVEGE